MIKIAGKRAWWVEFGEEAEGTVAVVLLSIAYKFVVFGEELSFSLHRLILGDCCRHFLHTPLRSITSPSLTAISTIFNPFKCRREAYPCRAHALAHLKPRKAQKHPKPRCRCRHRQSRRSVAIAHFCLCRKHDLFYSDARAHQEARRPGRLLVLRVHADGRVPCHSKDGQRARHIPCVRSAEHRLPLRREQRRPPLPKLPSQL